MSDLPAPVGAEDFKILSYKDKSDPKSMINIAPMCMSRPIETCPDDIFDMSEAELEHQLMRDKYARELSLVRTSFWLEYERATRAGLTMDVSNIVAGICDRRVFIGSIIANSFRVAYILKPHAEYKLQVEEMLQIGLRQMREILLLPNVDAKGRADAKLASVKQKIFDTVLDRAVGAVPKLVNQRNLNMNVDAAKDAQVIEVPKLEDLDAELMELASQLKLGPAKEARVVHAKEETPEGKEAEDADA